MTTRGEISATWQRGYQAGATDEAQRWQEIMERLLNWIRLAGITAALVAGVSLRAEAGPVTLSWDPSPGATGYEVEQSTDQGVTWVRVLDLTASACTGTPARCSAVHTAPSTGTVLFRFGAKNAVGLTRRYEVGSWHCQSCAPPLSPSNLGVQ